MIRVIFKHLILPVGLILGIPLIGTFFDGQDWIQYLDFPPRPVRTFHPPFSLPVFCFMGLFILAVLIPFIRKRPASDQTTCLQPAGALPWWGWLAFICFFLFWILAWTRFDWFALFQPHTFFPLWSSLILVVNALTFCRIKTCALIQPKFFILFPASALFWWVFEYLNRFVGNWIYTGSDYPAVQYFFLATLSFSTVLPAVESVKDYLLSFDRFKCGFVNCWSVKPINSRPAAVGMLVLSCIVLFFLGIFPDVLFLFVWICPFFIILGFLILSGRPHVLTGIKTGDYTVAVAYAWASMLCGFFWEMFNMFSLARWEYTIPYVKAFHIFEMPLLGYAGYLPFGLECAVIIGIIKNTEKG